MAAVRGTSMDEVQREFEGSGYGDFKRAVAEAVIDYLAPVRERYAALRADQEAIDREFVRGAAKAAAIAVDTLADVREAMGFARERPV